ncbi:MAG: nucleoside phosphorylase [Alistipes sp.]|nr:nucleoside phosphorylase [Alistipes sp.]
MPSRIIAPSELIINADGSVFHLHMRPEQLADTIILVGDPARVELIAKRLDSIESRAENREFNSATGYFQGKRMTILSTGIGIGNIDIAMTELDALANIDFATRTEKEQRRQLTILRLGTSGALQEDIEVGDVVFARTSLGFDGLLGFYAHRNEVCDLALEEAFVEHTAWSELMPRPYFVDASEELWEAFKDSTTEGITIASPGFYAPQGRWVRLKPADEQMNQKIEAFRHNGRRITNYEMEGSAIAGLAALMGHRAATMCTIIAQRVAKKANTDYKPFVERMIDMALERLAKF